MWLISHNKSNTLHTSKFWQLILLHTGTALAYWFCLPLLAMLHGRITLAKLLSCCSMCGYLFTHSKNTINMLMKQETLSLTYCSVSQTHTSLTQWMKPISYLVSTTNSSPYFSPVYSHLFVSTQTCCFWPTLSAWPKLPSLNHTLLDMTQL